MLEAIHNILVFVYIFSAVLNIPELWGLEQTVRHNSQWPIWWFFALIDCFY